MRLVPTMMVMIAGLSVPVFSAFATTITIQVADGPGEGFNDSTPVTPVTGNPGTTLGQQRLNVFQAAADYWETKLESPVEITVSAKFDPQPCSQFSGQLGAAGPRSIVRDFPGAPLANTWYPVALGNSLSGSGSSPSDPDIGAAFNSNLDSDPNCLGGAGWDYRIGVQTGSPLQLYSTVVHELGHGLGFLTFVNLSTGSKVAGLDDVFMHFLHDQQTGQDWSAMTDAQRVVSSVNTGELVWTGPKVQSEASFLSSGLNTGDPRMYAPNPAQPGSSVSHWDTALTPDEVMEPYATPVNEDWLTIKAFYDMGWQGNPCLRTDLPDNQWTQITLECQPPGLQNTVADLFGDDISGVYDTDWVIYGYDPTSGYFKPTLNDTLEQGRGYWIIQVTGSTVTLDIPRDSHRTPVQSSGICTSNKGCFEVPLATKPGVVAWNMVGSPFLSTVPFDDLRVVTVTGACSTGCTMSEAKAADIVHDTAWSYNAATPGYDVFSSGAQVPPRKGLWLPTLNQADGLDPKLVVPYL